MARSHKFTLIARGAKAVTYYQDLHDQRVMLKDVPVLGANGRSSVNTRAKIGTPRSDADSPAIVKAAISYGPHTSQKKTMTFHVYADRTYTMKASDVPGYSAPAAPAPAPAPQVVGPAIISSPSAPALADFFPSAPSYAPTAPSFPSAPAISAPSVMLRQRQRAGVAMLRRTPNKGLAQTRLRKAKLIRSGIFGIMDWNRKGPSTTTTQTWAQLHRAFHRPASSPVIGPTPEVPLGGLLRPPLDFLLSQLDPTSRAIYDSITEFYGGDGHHDTAQIAPLLSAHVMGRTRSEAKASLDAYINSWPVDRPLDPTGYREAVLNGAEAAGALSPEIPAGIIGMDYLAEVAEGPEVIEDEKILHTLVAGMKVTPEELRESIEDGLDFVEAPLVAEPEPEPLYKNKMVVGVFLAATVAGGMYLKARNEEF